MGYGHVAGSSGRSMWRLTVPAWRRARWRRRLCGDRDAAALGFDWARCGCRPVLQLAAGCTAPGRCRCHGCGARNQQGKTTDEVEAAATSDAEDNGFVAARGDTIAVNSPPTTGDFSSDATAAEVQITRPVQLSFVRFVGADSNITVSARAVARPVRPEACVWSLEPIEIGIEVTGTAQVDLNCGVYSRSTSGEAIDQNGTSCLTATSVVTAGGTSGTCIHPTPRNGAAQIDDPLASLPAPSTATSCDEPNEVKIKPTATISTCPGIKSTARASTSPAER